MLAGMSLLRCLDLTRNPLGVAGASALVPALERLASLSELGYSWKANAAADVVMRRAVVGMPLLSTFS